MEDGLSSRGETSTSKKLHEETSTSKKLHEETSTSKKLHGETSTSKKLHSHPSSGLLATMISQDLCHSTHLHGFGDFGAASKSLESSGGKLSKETQGTQAEAQQAGDGGHTTKKVPYRYDVSEKEGPQPWKAHDLNAEQSFFAGHCAKAPVAAPSVAPLSAPALQRSLLVQAETALDALEEKAGASATSSTASRLAQPHVEASSTATHTATHTAFIQLDTSKAKLSSPASSANGPGTSPVAKEAWAPSEAPKHEDGQVSKQAGNFGDDAPAGRQRCSLVTHHIRPSLQHGVDFTIDAASDKHMPEKALQPHHLTSRWTDWDVGSSRGTHGHPQDQHRHQIRPKDSVFGQQLNGQNSLFPRTFVQPPFSPFYNPTASVGFWL